MPDIQTPISDPRVFFSAERTLLSWVRSGLTVIALGFVVARFGFFLSVFSAAAGHATSGHNQAWSNALGVLLVVMGATAILAAMQNHRLYVRSLPPHDVPEMPMPWLTTAFSLAIAVAGMLLAVYLVVA